MIVQRLRAAGCVFAEDEAALLTEAATSPEDLERLVAARVAGAPIEVLLGWVDFAGIRVVVEPGVFVPRQRSALLVRLAVERLPRAGVVVDLGCGTGALAAAVLAVRPDAVVHAADVDPAAVACARRNLPPDRVHEGDLYAALPGRLRGQVDLLLANAPYVPTAAIALMPPEAREHEHRVALDGGADGLDVQRRVISAAGTWLAPRGRLVIELGSDQVAEGARLMRAGGLAPETVRDDSIGACALVGSVPDGPRGV